MTKYGLLVILLALFLQCSVKTDETKRQAGNQYAGGFEIDSTGPVKTITIYNPWEQAKNVVFKYYLIKKGQPVPDSLKGEKIIFTPADRVVCLSTSHIAFLEALGVTDRIVGISGSNYINNEKIRGKIKTGEVVDVGYDESLNYELLLKQKPDLIFVYGIGSEVSSTVMKMKDLGLNVFFISEYLEKSPLGKAEWIKCFAPLFEKEKAAAGFFGEIEKDYNSLKDMAAKVVKKPNVMVGLTYRDSWWVPGGKSYLSNLINDAGGNYVGKDNPSHESFVLSFENALTISEGVDFWINVGSANSKAEILAGDERFKKFPAFNKAKIFNNNNRMSPDGGNDFWESGAVYPNLILKDMIGIFHPELSDGKNMVYYREIK
jgi:iron complex transport system substrate-binding protein